MTAIKESVDDIIRTFYNNRFPTIGDVRVDSWADSVRLYYKGYPHVLIWKSEQDDIDYEEIDLALAWCRKNCAGLYTTHIHHVVSCFDDWVFNPLGGYEYCFFAFDNEEDALMFKLKW